MLQNIADSAEQSAGINGEMSAPRPADTMLTTGFREVCDGFMQDGGQTDQMQLRLLDRCFIEHGEDGPIYDPVMVQDLMVYLMIERGFAIGAVRDEIRSLDYEFAHRVSVVVGNRTRAAQQLEEVAA